LVPRPRGRFEGNFQFLDLAWQLNENALQLAQAAQLAEQLAEKDRQMLGLAAQLTREKDHAARASAEEHSDKERLVEGLIAQNLEKERTLAALMHQYQEQGERLRRLEARPPLALPVPPAPPHPLRRFATRLAPQGTRRRRAARMCLGLASRTVAGLRAALTGL
jgi:hypothetical protein